MKNQYFGDINDYRKYGLIRVLTGCGELSSAICWMLTEDDASPDGSKIRYLHQTEKWRRYDPELFDHLKQTVLVESIRDVRLAKKVELIPGATYYDNLVEDNKFNRRVYFDAFLEEAEGKDLYFFDPDNGMEVASIHLGRKNSSKYLFWGELENILKEGASILIYQHFPREKRENFIARMVNEFRQVHGFEKIITFRTANVVFFLLVLGKHIDHIYKGINELKKQWGDQFDIKIHKHNEQRVLEMNDQNGKPLLKQAVKEVYIDRMVLIDGLKEKARVERQRSDFVWHRIVESFSTMGSSRGYAGLMENPERYQRLTYKSIESMDASTREDEISRVFQESKVRWPNRKAQYLVVNFELVKEMGGSQSVTGKLWECSGKDEKIAFLKQFMGIGDKQSRDIMMNSYDPDFHDSIAIDTRIQRICSTAGLNFPDYESQEKYLVELAHEIGITGWELDRLMYWFKDEIIEKLG